MMGLLSWLVRKGNVGATARSVAKGWKVITTKHPNMNNEQIAKIYIDIRYGPAGELDLAKDVIYLLNDGIISPLNLAWNILLVENIKERDTFFDHYIEWRKIMKEEIEKFGVEAE